ncbi:MAG: hypothetical protein Q8O11_06470 [Syntrophales bacterium]|nr:hypothetical protein [Syntrophales bacterium]
MPGIPVEKGDGIGYTPFNLRSHPAVKGILGVFNRLFRRLPVGHAAGQIGKSDQKTAPLCGGKRLDLKRVICKFWFHRLYLLDLVNQFKKTDNIHGFDGRV